MKAWHKWIWTLPLVVPIVLILGVRSERRESTASIPVFSSPKLPPLTNADFVLRCDIVSYPLGLSLSIEDRTKEILKSAEVRFQSVTYGTDGHLVMKETKKFLLPGNLATTPTLAMSTLPNDKIFVGVLQGKIKVKVMLDLILETYARSTPETIRYELPCTAHPPIGVS